MPTNRLPGIGISMNFSTLTGPPAPSPPGGPAALFACGYKEEQAERQEKRTVDPVKLVWQDEEGPFKDRDVISRSEYDLPTPYGGTGSAKMVVVILRDPWDEENPDSCQLVVHKDRGPGTLTMTYPDLETAKKTAVRWMQELVRRTTEPAKAAE